MTRNVRAIFRRHATQSGGRKFLRDKNFHNLCRPDNVDVIEGRAEFIDNHTLRVFQADGERCYGEKRSY